MGDESRVGHVDPATRVTTTVLSSADDVFLDVAAVRSAKDEGTKLFVLYITKVDLHSLWMWEPYLSDAWNLTMPSKVDAPVTTLERKQDESFTWHVQRPGGCSDTECAPRGCPKGNPSCCPKECWMDGKFTTGKYTPKYSDHVNETQYSDLWGDDVPAQMGYRKGFRPPILGGWNGALRWLEELKRNQTKAE